MMTELKKWKLACPKCDLDLVFPNDAGGVIDDSSMLRRHFHPAFKRANLPRIRFHDLRHTYASLLIEQGENIKYIQKQMGHSKPSVTMDIYAHLMDEENPEAAKKLDDTIFQTGSKMVAEIFKLEYKTAEPIKALTSLICYAIALFLMITTDGPDVTVASLTEVVHTATVYVHAPSTDGSASVSRRRPVGVGLHVVKWVTRWKCRTIILQI